MGKRKLDGKSISRILNSKQVRKPENRHDALANLCQLFAASVGEDDVKLFKYHVRYDRQSRTVSKGNDKTTRTQTKRTPTETAR